MSFFWQVLLADAIYAIFTVAAGWIVSVIFRKLKKKKMRTCPHCGKPTRWCAVCGQRFDLPPEEQAS